MSLKGNDRLGWLELWLYALCWVAPLAIDAAHPPTQIALAAAAGLLLLFAALRSFRIEGVRVTPLAWVMLAAMAWTALQLLPLPLSLLQVVSPRAAELRRDLSDGWAPISLDAAGTTLELAKQLGYVTVILIGAELLRGSAGVRRAAISLALLGGVLSIIALSHMAIGATKIYGFYAPRSHPGLAFFAPFVNRNHAAGLLSLCAMAAIGVAAGGRDRARFGFGLLAMLVSATVLATASRGGAVGIAVAGLVLALLLATAQFGRTRGVALALGVTLVLGVAGFYLADGLRQRITHNPSGEAQLDNQKTRGWGAALRLAGRFPLVGVGRGAFEAPVAETRFKDEGTRLVYPENLVLQVVSEWGYPFGLGLLLAGAYALVTAFARCKRDAYVAGLFAGVLGLLVHELFDFGLEMPGSALPLSLALGALAGRADADRRTRRGPRARLHPVLLVGGAVLASLLVYAGLRADAHTLAADIKPLRGLIDARDATASAQIDAAILRHPASAELEILAGEAALRRADASALHHLSRAMRLQPSASLPHHLAGIELARRGRPRQAALELKLAMSHGEWIEERDLVGILGAAAIEAVDGSSTDLCRVGGAYAIQKRWDDAERAFARAAELGGGEEVERVRLLAMSAAPPERRLRAAEAAEAAATTPAAVATALQAYGALGKTEQAEALLQRALKRFPGAAAVIVAGARQRAAHGDLAGARELLERSHVVDRPGRALVEELRIELADRAGDVDGAAAARARLRILRAKLDLEDLPVVGKQRP